MSKDAIDSVKPKKSKKSKHADANADVVTATNDVDAKVEKKKRKREAETEAATTVTTDEGNTKKHKKKKSKVAEDCEAPEPVAIEASTEPSKKSKSKRKREEDPAEPTVDASHQGPSGIEDESAAAEAKKEKKRRKKEAKEAAKASGATATSSSLPTAQPGAGSSTDAAAFLAEHAVTISDPSITPFLSFDALPVSSEMKASFSGFKQPTPIQACTWPPAFLGKDVVGIAETGSGKTLAFGIPALQRLMDSPPSSSSSSNITVLVVAPTRELAIQTHDTLSKIGAKFGIGSVAVFGGVPKEAQVKLLRKMNKQKGGGIVTRIIVGTPGRILDLNAEGVCDLSCVDYLVLDEADRMLDRGFENDIRRIIAETKQGSQRQTMMFSATWPDSVRRLASTFQQNPVRVTVGSDDLTANTRVEQSLEVLDDQRQKDARLLHHLKTLNHTKGSQSESRVIVFVLYKREIGWVERLLQRNNYTVSPLNGDMTQNARMDSLEDFKASRTGILLATDVAARGLDIPNVKAVINYTFPLTTEDYVHRIGRTGRGGKTGKSITFFTGEGQEKGLAGELAKVLTESGFEDQCTELRNRFSMTIKKKEHSAYGAFFRDDIPVSGKKKIVFD